MDDNIYKAPFTVDELCRKLPFIAYKISFPVWFRDGNDRLWPVIESYNDELDDKTPCLILSAKPLDIQRIIEKERLESHSNEQLQ